MRTGEERSAYGRRAEGRSIATLAVSSRGCRKADATTSRIRAVTAGVGPISSPFWSEVTSDPGREAELALGELRPSAAAVDRQRRGKRPLSEDVHAENAAPVPANVEVANGRNAYPAAPRGPTDRDRPGVVTTPQTRAARMGRAARRASTGQPASPPTAAVISLSPITATTRSSAASPPDRHGVRRLAHRRRRLPTPARHGARYRHELGVDRHPAPFRLLAGAHPDRRRQPNVHPRPPRPPRSRWRAASLPGRIR